MPCRGMAQAPDKVAGIGLHRGEGAAEEQSSPVATPGSRQSRGAWRPAVGREATPGWEPSSRPAREDEQVMRRRSTSELWKADGEPVAAAYRTDKQLVARGASDKMSRPSYRRDLAAQGGHCRLSR
jgi:hypothetical protein